MCFFLKEQIAKNENKTFVTVCSRKRDRQISLQHLKTRNDIKTQTHAYPIELVGFIEDIKNEKRILLVTHRKL